MGKNEVLWLLQQPQNKPPFLTHCFIFLHGSCSFNTHCSVKFSSATWKNNHMLVVRLWLNYSKNRIRISAWEEKKQVMGWVWWHHGNQTGFWWYWLGISVNSWKFCRHNPDTIIVFFVVVKRKTRLSWGLQLTGGKVFELLNVSCQHSEERPLSGLV